MSILDSFEKWFVKNSSTILSVGAGIGCGITMILSGKAALKASETIEECEKDDHQMTKKEFLTKVVPIYIPTFASFIATEVCIIGSCKISRETEAKLTLGNVLLSTAFAKYRSKIDPEIDEEVMDEVLDEMEELDDKKRSFILDFYPDPVIATREQMKDSFLYVNEMISEHGQCSVDDYCDYMDLPLLRFEKIEDIKGWFGPGYLYGWGRNELEYYKGNCFVKFTIDPDPFVDDSGVEFYYVYSDITPQFNFDAPVADYGSRNLQLL